MITNFFGVDEIQTFFQIISTYNTTLIKWDNDLDAKIDITPTFKDKLIELSTNIATSFDKLRVYLKEKEDKLINYSNNIKHKADKLINHQNEIKFKNKSKTNNNLLFYGSSNYYNKLGNDILTILFNIFNSMKVAKNGSLIIETNKQKTLKSDIEYEFEQIIIKSGAVLTVKPWNSRKQKGGKLIIHALSNIIIHENATINLIGLGYKGGKIGGTSIQGESINGIGTKSTKPNIGGGASGDKDNEYDEWSGGNGSYGSKGKYGGDTASAGNTYGDKYLTNLYLGSGGGSTNYGWRGDGGNGGGALYLYSQQTVCVNGNINVDGSEGGNRSQGNGSGGSIYIKTSHFEMGKNGSITAIGGGDGIGGRRLGGDGRIRIDCKTKKSYQKK